MPALALFCILLGPLLRGPESQDPPPPAVAPAEADELAANEQLAAQLLSAVRGKNYPALAEMLNARELLDRASEGLGLDPAFQKDWHKDAGLAIKIKWTGDLKDLAEDSNWSIGIVGVRGTSAARTLLFRLRRASSSLFAYLECWTARGKDQHWKIVDWIAHSEGESQTHRVRRELLTAVPDSKRPDPASLAGLDRAYFDHAELVRRLLGTVPKAQWAETLPLFDSLPADLHGEACLQLAELRLASWLGDVEHVRACYDRFVARHAEQPAADLWAFLYDLWGKNDERVLGSVRRLRTLLGGDSQLDVIESNVLVKRGELAAAIKLAERARASEPDWIQPYWGCVSIALKQHDYPAVLQALLALDAHFKIEWPDFSKNEGYKEFIASPQHAEWLRHLSEKK